MIKKIFIIILIFACNYIFAQNSLFRVDNNLDDQVEVLVSISDCSTQSFIIPQNSRMILNVLSGSFYDISINCINTYDSRKNLISESCIPYYQDLKYSGTIITVNSDYLINPISDIRIGSVGYPSQESNNYGIQQISGIKITY